MKRFFKKYGMGFIAGLIAGYFARPMIDEHVHGGHIE